VRLMMVTAHDLHQDPRARRAARTAEALGIEVVTLSPGEPSSATAAAPRRALPSGTLARELRGLWRLGRLVATSTKLLRRARATPPVDVVHAHDFETLPAAWRIARRGNARLVYDAHEIYSDQEPDPPRLHRTVVSVLERWFARRADAVVTVNDPIAQELEGRLGLRARPLVVLNCPRLIDAAPAVPHDGPLRVVYQGAMGPGRYLDDLLDAAVAAPGIELTLRVAGSDLDALRADVRKRGLDGRVRVVEPVAPDVLVESLVGFDVGLVINRPVTLNDELVLPNKLFEYLMAGLAVVVPNLRALAPVVDGVGLTYPPGETSALAAALERLAADRDFVLALSATARERAIAEYNAESQAGVLATAWKA
jgi:glycogen(starch) synthase